MLKINEPAVLGAVFSLGNCLDLTDKKFLDIVNDIYGIYEIFHLTDQRPFDSVRALLPEGKPLYTGAIDCIPADHFVIWICYGFFFFL